MNVCQVVIKLHTLISFGNENHKTRLLENHYLIDCAKKLQLLHGRLRGFLFLINLSTLDIWGVGLCWQSMYLNWSWPSRFLSRIRLIYPFSQSKASFSSAAGYDFSFPAKLELSAATWEMEPIASFQEIHVPQSSIPLKHNIKRYTQCRCNNTT